MSPQWWEIDGHLEVLKNELFIGGENCVKLANKFETPTYVYNSERIKSNFFRIRDSLEKHADREVSVYYAVKANFNPQILSLLSGLGAYADIVSLNEAYFARYNGFIAERIMFTGTSVDDGTMQALLDSGVMINIDSFSQLERLAKYAPKGLEISVRWNPGKGAGFNPKTITAGAESHGRPIKFGIEEKLVLKLCERAKRLGLKVKSLHQHIGSGWLGEDVYDFLDTVSLTLDMARKMTKALGYSLDQVDFGGGPGIRYKEDQKDFPVDAYGKGICDRVKASNLKFERICIEPGRYIVGDSGVLLTRVNTVEVKNGNLIVGVDAGFNTLIRPAFYGAHHEIVDASRILGPEDICTIAGPLCETGDLLAIKRRMTRPREGDVLAILNAGAYGYSMSSVYNLQPRAAEVMVTNGSPRLITRRETVRDLKRLHV